MGDQVARILARVQARVGRVMDARGPRRACVHRARVGVEPAMMSTPTTIYRVEDDQGAGPYTASGKGLSGPYCPRQPEHRGFSRGPGPTIFGFRTLGQLLRWFNAWERARLREDGFKVVEYQAETDYVVDDETRTQVVFVRGGMVSKQEIPE